jgi:putative membrane protein
MMLRLIIVVAVAVAAATSAFAQIEAGKPAASTDQEYFRQSLAASSLTLAASRIAALKAQSDDLKEFAGLEEEEQATLADVLKSLLTQTASLNDPTGRRLSDAEVEQNLDQEGRDTLEKLRAEPAGTEFDRAYLAVLSTGHLELLRIQENYLDSGRNSTAVINVAVLVRTMIKQHLQLLADIESGMESDADDTTGAELGKD